MEPLECMDSCIICLEADGEARLLSTDLHTGECECQYWVHKACMRQWLETKPSQSLKCINCGSKVELRDQYQNLEPIRPGPQPRRIYSSGEYVLAGLIYSCLAVLIYTLAYYWVHAHNLDNLPPNGLD